MDTQTAHEIYFQPFPNEVWEIILEHVGNTDDILSVFHVFPQLTCLTRGKHFTWLIGKVMPLIMKPLNFNDDAKACRLVSRRWKNAVDASLETHPDLLPYKSHRNWRLPETHFQYFRSPRYLYNWDSDMQDYPSDGNPFPSRQYSIKLYFYKDEMETRYVTQTELVKFGNHIYFFRVDVSVEDDCEEEQIGFKCMDIIFQCLTHLPHLRSFRYSLTFRTARRSKQNEDASSILPENRKTRIGRFVSSIPGLVSSGFDQMCSKILPPSDNIPILKANLKVPVLSNLEMLDLTYLSGIRHVTWNHMVTSLLQHDQVKMLGIHADYWDTQYSSLFPNLSDLHVYCGCDAPLKSLRHILQELDAPNLQKLRVHCDRLPIYELFRVLSPYNIEALELVGYDFCDCNLTDKMVPSITNLKLRGSGRSNYQFLKLLPNLRHLSIFGDENFRILSSPFQPENISFLWNNYIFTQSLLNLIADDEIDPVKARIVWETLPTLEMITVYRYPARQYIREYPNKVFVDAVPRNTWPRFLESLT